MANYSGNTGTIIIGADEVAELLDYTISTGVVTIDNSTVSDVEDTHLIGTGNWSASISCFWDDTDTAGQGVMKAGDSATFDFQPSSTSGFFTGTATIEGLEIGLARNSIVTASFTAKGDGELIELTNISALLSQQRFYSFDLQQNFSLPFGAALPELNTERFV